METSGNFESDKNKIGEEKPDKLKTILFSTGKSMLVNIIEVSSLQEIENALRPMLKERLEDIKRLCFGVKNGRKTAIESVLHLYETTVFDATTPSDVDVAKVIKTKVIADSLEFNINVAIDPSKVENFFYPNRFQENPVLADTVEFPKKIGARTIAG